jgi:hypothetical protein
LKEKKKNYYSNKLKKNYKNHDTNSKIMDIDSTKYEYISISINMKAFDFLNTYKEIHIHHIYFLYQ